MFNKQIKKYGFIALIVFGAIIIIGTVLSACGLDNVKNILFNVISGLLGLAVLGAGLYILLLKKGKIAPDSLPRLLNKLKPKNIGKKVTPCPYCGAKLRLPGTKKALRVHCPACGKSFCTPGK